MTLSDWVSCPEKSCTKPESATITIEYTGDLGVGCDDIGCESGTDISYWLHCPECHSDECDILASATKEGKVDLECADCGKSTREYPQTKWTVTGRQPNE